MAFVFVIAAAAIAGRYAVFGVDVPGMEGRALRLYAGLCLSAVFFALVGSVSLMAALGAAIVFVMLRPIYRGRALSGLREPGEPAARLPIDLGRVDIACLAVIGIANGLALFSALAPNTNWDAGAAHLALPSDYVREGRVGLIEGNVYSAYPHLLHTLYAVAFTWGGETSVSLLNWIFGPLACIALYALGARVAGRRCGLVAAAIFATSPIFFDQVGTVSIDVAFAGLAAAGLACLARWFDEKLTGVLALAAFLAGSACGIRHTGYLVCALMLAAVLMTGHDKRFVRGMQFAAIAGLAAAPWLLRSALVSGNPFYPFFSGIFPSPALPDMQTTALAAHETVRDIGLLNLVRFPWDVVMHPERFDGWSASPGALVLLLGVPGLFVGNRKTRALGAFSAAGFVCFFFFQRLARYMLPFFMPLMVVAAVAAQDIERLRKPATVLLFVFFGYGLTLGAGAVHFKVPVALGLDTRDNYLAARVERYNAFRWVNENLSDNCAVLTFDPRSYFIDRPTFQNYAVLPVLGNMSARDLDAWFAERNIRYVLYPPAFFEGSPAYVARGYVDVVDAWRADSERFKLVKVIGASGPDRVEIYEVVPRAPIEESAAPDAERGARVGA